jgi:hypothetical protein
VRDEDWALMRQCAAEVIAEARQWWPRAPEQVKQELTQPLTRLAQGLEAMDEPGGRFAPLMQKSLMWACYRAAEAVRVNVTPDEYGDDLWTAGARLAYATTGIKAELVG